MTNSLISVLLVGQRVYGFSSTKPRRIQWTWLGHAIISYGSLTLHLSTLQMYILLQFNEHEVNQEIHAGDVLEVMLHPSLVHHTSVWHESQFFFFVHFDALYKRFVHFFSSSCFSISSVVVICRLEKWFLYCCWFKIILDNLHKNSK